MTPANIKKMQERIGVEPDGFWGRKSIAACEKHLRDLMPKKNPWPASDQASLRAFYGDPDDNKVIVSVEAPVWLRLYDGDKQVTKISCHDRVASSLLRALYAAYDVAPNFTKRYFGCHVDRNMRGGTKPSLHAYGAAIDLSATTNGNKDSWPIKGDMPLEVMECFAKESWIAAGAFWGRDAMHFQATR
jgi:hypothetical protein